MVEKIEDLLDEAINFAKEHWKTILIFFILVIIGVAGILYQTTSELKQTQQTIEEDSISGIVDAFTDAGKETSENIDPATKIIYQFLWWFLGVMFVLIIILAIKNTFEPIIKALNPWEIAKSLSK